MRGDARLSSDELRLVDLLVAGGVFADAPVAVARPLPEPGAHSGPVVPLTVLRRLRPAVEATARPLGEGITYASVAGLVALRTADGARGPDLDDSSRR